MAGEVGGINVKIGADNSGLKKGVKDSKRSISELRDSANKTAKSFAAYGAAATAAGLAVSAALFKGSAEAAKEIKNLSMVSNESAQSFQKQAQAVKTVGIEQEKYADILKDVNDRVGDFVTTGGGPMVDFFEKIAPKVGVTAKQFQNLSGKDALQLYVDTLEKANVNQQEMTFFLEAMASDATALLPLLKNGGEGFAAMAEHTESLGLALSDIDIEKLSMADTQIKQLTSRFDSATQQVSAKFAPALDAVSHALDQFIIDAGGMDKVADEAFGGIVQAAGFAADAAEGVNRVFKGAANSIIIAFAAVAGKVAESIQSIVSVASMIPGSIGDSFEAPLAKITEFAQLQSGVIKQAMADNAALLNEPLPSAAIDEAIENSKKLSDAAAQARINAGGGTDGEGSGNLEETQALKRKEAQAKELEELQAFLESKADIIAENNELALIAADNGIMAEDLRRSEQEQKEIDSLQRIYRSNVSAERKLSAFKNANHKAQQAMMLKNGLGALATMAGFNRKAFELNKKAGIAQALIGTYQGIAEGVKLGFPAAIPAVAAAAATGFAQVSKIKSQSFGGGGGGGGGGGAVSSGGGGSSFASQTGTASSGEAQQTQNINISGISATDLISGGQLVSVLNEAIGDGATITGVN